MGLTDTPQPLLFERLPKARGLPLVTLDSEIELAAGGVSAAAICAWYLLSATTSAPTNSSSCNTAAANSGTGGNTRSSPSSVSLWASFSC